MSLIHNERIKLTATALNGVAIASVAVGGIGPLVSAFVGTGIALPVVVASFMVWLSIATGLHLLGRALLGRLRE